MTRQFIGMPGRAVLRQVAGGRDAQPPVVGQPHADQRRVGQVADPHRAVKTFAGEIDHPVTQIERNRDVAVQFAKPRHQRRHVAAPEARRRGDAQMATGLDAAGADAGLRVGHIRQQPLRVFQEGGALVGE